MIRVSDLQAAHFLLVKNYLAAFIGPETTVVQPLERD